MWDEAYFPDHNHDWTSQKLGEILEKIIDFRGKTPRKLGMSWDNGPIPALSAKNVRMGHIDLSLETNYGSSKLYTKWMTTGDAKRGDVLITMEAPLGNIAQIPDEKLYFLSQRVVLLRFHSDQVLNDYMAMYMRHQAFQASLHRHSTGTTATGIQRRKLVQIPIRFPPLPEQRRIAEILVTLDEAILKTEQVIDKLQQMKEGLLHDLLTRGVDENGELRDPDRFPEQFKPSPLGRIPQDWEFGPLKRWLNRNPKNGYSPPEADRPTGIAMLGLGCLTRSGFEPKQIKYAPTSIDRTHYAILQDGDLLISRANTRPSVGMAGVYNDIGKPCIYPDLMIRLVANRDTSASFLEKILQSHNSRRQIEALAVGTSESMVKISSKIVQELQVAIPTPGEQEAILEILHRKKDILSMEVQDLKKLQTLKQGLMDDLLTGRVRVHVGKEAEEEASVHA